jgi:hypothetical protein
MMSYDFEKEEREHHKVSNDPDQRENGKEP